MNPTLHKAPDCSLRARIGPPYVIIEESPSPQVSTCFIALLPTEVLAIIFHHVVADTQRQYVLNPPLYNFSSATPPDSWLCLSGVCKHWKSVVENTPTLWASFIFLDASLPRMEAIFDKTLQRSGDAPIQHLYVGRVDRPTLQDPRRRLQGLDATRLHARTLQSIIKILPQIQGITVHVRSLYDFPAAEYTIQGDCTKLRYINVNSDSSAHSTTPFISSLSELPLCSLQSLSLTRFAFPLASQFFRPTLKELYLEHRYSGVIRQNVFTHQTLMDSLRSMPFLEILSLQFYIKPSLTEYPDNGFTDSVKLPRLRVLRIVDIDYLTILNLPCIELPAKTKLFLNCCTIYYSLEDGLAGLPALLNLASDTLQMTWGSSLTSEQVTLGLTIDMTAGPPVIHTSGTFGPGIGCLKKPDFSVSYRAIYETHLEEAVRKVEGLLVCSVSVLILLQSESFCLQCKWPEILHQLQEVHTIGMSTQARGTYTPEHISALCWDDKTVRIPFPKLSRLSLLLGDMVQSLYKYSDIYTHYEYLVSALRETLKLRRERGYPLQSLQIKLEVEVKAEVDDVQMSILKACPLVANRIERELSDLADTVKCWVETKAPPFGLSFPMYHRTIGPDRDEVDDNTGPCLHCSMVEPVERVSEISSP